MPITPGQASSQVAALERSGQVSYITSLNLQAQLRGMARNPNIQLPDDFVQQRIVSYGQEHGSSEGGTYTSPSGQRISLKQAQSVGITDRPGAASEKLRAIGGAASTAQIEQRMGIEEARKRGEITNQEAIALTIQNIEGRPLQIVQQEEQKRRADVESLQEFRERTGALSPVGRGYREATQREITQIAPERVFVKINGRNVPFVPSEKAEQQRPITQLLRKAEQSIYDKNVELSNILKYDVPGKIPQPITNFFDAIDKRAELSFQSKKPLNPFALRNVAEAFYNIEKGMVKGVAEQPLTAGASLLLGGALAKGAGVLAARVPLLTKGVSAGRVGRQVSALNIAGGAMAGYYGADVAKRIAAADNRNQVIGKILSTEIIPFAAGAKLTRVTAKDIQAAAREARIAGYQVRGTAKDVSLSLSRALQTQRKTMNEFIRNERAAMQMQLSRQGITPQLYISAEQGLAGAAKSSYVSRVYSISEIVGLRAADIGRSFALSETSMMTALKSKIKNLEAKISDPNRPRQSKKNIEFEQKILQQWKKELKELQQVSSKQPDVTIKVGKITQKQISASIGAIAKPELKSAVRQVQPNASKQFQANISAQIDKTNLQISGIGLKQVKKPAIKTPSGFVKGAVARQKTLQKISRGALLGIMTGVSQAQRVSQAISPAQQYAGALKSAQAQHSGNIQAIRSIQGLTPFQATGQITPQIQKQTQIQRQVQRQEKIKTPREVTIKKPPRKPPKKKPPKIPLGFDEQLGDFEKARKKRGKFVWNVRNQIPTLESLIG